MRECLHLRAEDARSVPWRNGRGVTDELAVWPLAASFERGDFAWRIARAPVVEPGPFSAFPGFERVLIVTEGRGLVLAHGADAPRARLRPLEPYRFAGDWATDAALPDGPVRDLNVLVRRGRAAVDAEVLRLGARAARVGVGPGHAFVHALGGRIDARVTEEEDGFALAPAESLWARGLVPGDELDLAGRDAGSVAVLFRLTDESS
jgi:environmental stress-induced protein Ves